MGSKLFRWFKVPERIVYSLVVFFGLTYVLFSYLSSDFSGNSSSFTYYTDLMKVSFSLILRNSIFYFLLVFLTAIPATLVLSLYVKKDPLVLFKTRLLTLRADLLLCLWVLIFFCLEILSTEKASKVLFPYLKDSLLMTWDRALFGDIPFVKIGLISMPDAFVYATAFAYLQLSVVMFLTAVFLFVAHRYNFSRLVAAFSWAGLIMFIFWLILPALTPLLRFVHNPWQLPNPTPIEERLESYKAIPPYLAKIESLFLPKQGNPLALISTFPSPHIVWIIIFGYFLWKTYRPVGILILPFLILSAFGTILFAQHYAVDVLSGIVVSILILIFCNKLYGPPLKFGTEPITPEPSPK